ncbi:hypothetical protein [Aquimarina algiphila]|uniref:hypothetical protein n=1 Tax=Aquimarina algiphila TaxID=2047982 RepID=UPI002490BF15|nr:hypothetical protein [Aquimarina algiphila]
MKKSFFFLCSLFLLNGCSEKTENSISDNPDQSNNLSYVFSAADLKKTLAREDLLHFHVRPILTHNNQLDVQIVGVTSDHKEYEVVSATVQKNILDLNKLKKMPEVSQQEIEAQNKIVSQHIIQATKGYKYANTFLKNGNLFKNSESLTYNGDVIHYFILEKEIVADIIERSNMSAMAIFWGVNDNFRLTPVFMGINDNHHKINDSKTDNNIYVYDIVRPVPPFGNGEPPF